MLTVYAFNTRASKFMKQKLIELNKSTITVIDFNIPLSNIDRIYTKKIRKDIVDLSSTVNQLDLIDIY